MNGSDDVLWNQKHDELEWWSMKVSATKICNKSNHTEVGFNKENNCSLLAVTHNIWLNRRKDEW